MTEPTRLIVGMTGATGAIYGVRLLEVLRDTSSASGLNRTSCTKPTDN